MNKIIVKGIFIGLLVCCQPEKEVPTQVGQLTSFSPTWQYLDVDKIKNIDEFDSAYEEQTKLKSNFRFILPYNFEKKQIAANQSGQRGIPIIGIPFECSIYCCKYRDILIEVDQNQKHQIEFERVDKAALKSG